MRTFNTNMKPVWSIDDIDLTPKAGKKYWKNVTENVERGIHYFLLVDRFHDDLIR